MTGMDDLVTWLRDQLDEDERVAREATQARWWHNPRKQWLRPEAFEAYDQTKGEEYVGYGQSPLSGCVAATGPADHPQSMADATHIAHWDPVRVLAEVDAKRRLLDHLVALEGKALDGNWWNLDTDEPIKLLAAPYADRPGYREEWRP